MRTTILIKCCYCGKDVNLEKWYVEKQLKRDAKRFFCNYPCFRLWSKKNNGDKHPRWKGGYNGMYERLKEDIKARSLKYYYQNKEKVINRIKKYAQKNKEKIRRYRKKYQPIANRSRLKLRHELGISKKYHSDMGISYTKEYRKLQKYKRRCLLKHCGELSIKTIQMVYEDNIKKYGTLTCYLCLKSIPFKKDHLEHKTPLSRGGTNEYYNLGIACQHCNCKKHTKTVEEYKMEV